jgi:carboxymethylenebutenolidase
MKTNTLMLVIALSVAASAALAQDWARAKLEKSPRHGEWVTIPHGGRTVHAYLVFPEVKNKAQAVIVIHEIFGLTDWARGVADDLAARGYVAIAPDLLSGFGPKGGRSSDFPTVEATREAVSKLDPAVVTADLNAVADHVKKLPAADGTFSVAGFCWGGTQSFRFAGERKDLRAAYVFYGSGPQDVSGISAPVYGFYAENDARIGATLPATTAAMKAAGKRFEPETYARSGHGFMRAGEDPAGTPDNKKAREDAWVRFEKLLAK